MQIKKFHTTKYFKNRLGHKPILIVDHITEGGYDGAVSWLHYEAPKGAPWTSSNYVVAKDGRITELVPIWHGAWCNGTNMDKPGANNYYKKSKNKYINSKPINANWISVSIEHEGYSFKDNKGHLTEPQYQATLWLHEYIIKEINRLYGYTIPIDTDHIIGHKHVAPIEKPNCPSVNDEYPFDRLIKDLKQRFAGTKPSVIPAPKPTIIKPTKDATPSVSSKLYRVQVGAFSHKANADKLLSELKAKGYDGFIV